MKSSLFDEAIPLAGQQEGMAARAACSSLLVVTQGNGCQEGKGLVEVQQKKLPGDQQRPDMVQE